MHVDRSMELPLLYFKGSQLEISKLYRSLHKYSCFIEFIKQVGKRDKMRGLSSILSLFCNGFNKFNNTRA